MRVLSAEAKRDGERRADASFLPGQLVDGKYRIERLIGVGGMASVWAGTNERTGKRVALKVILRSLANTPAARELFYSEGFVASRVNHPNVVTMFDVIEHEGMTCMVMELLDGEPLSRMLERQGTLSVQEAIWLLLPAMRGVSAAHAQGVIHRDLKPQNIFLCIEPSGRIVTTKVLDFGISVLLDRVLDLSRGLFVGTPNYMSPEHVAGAALIDGRADVYGFGGVLFEALTGRVAFPGEPGPTLFDAIMNQPAPLVTSLCPDAPSGLASLIEKAMAKQPNDRFASLNEMITALEAELLALGLGVPSPSALPGPSEAAANVASAKEPNTPVPHPETMALYTFSTEAPESKPNAPVGNSASGGAPGLAADTVEVRVKTGVLARFITRGWPSRLGWKVGLATALGIGLVILVWNAKRLVSQIEAANSGMGPRATQVAATGGPVAAPASVLEEPALVIPELVATEPVVLEMPAMVVEYKKTARVRSTTSASAARTRMAAQDRVSGKSRREAAHAESTPVPRTNSAARLTTRAGTLSADDF